MRRPSIRTALAGAATAAVVLLGVTGLAAAGTAGAGISTDEQAIAALDQARGDIDAVRSYVASRPTTPPTTTTPPPSTGQDTAAGRLGWGTPLASSDEFNGTAVDTSKWGVPGECWPANSTVRGGRCASHNAVGNGYLRETQTADGKTGYVSSTLNQKYGRWEARMRVTTATPGKPAHPVALLWNDTLPYPQGGEVDWFEVDSNASKIASFVHHPTKSGTVQDPYVGPALDMAQWFNVAVDWQPGKITGYLNGVPWFSDTAALAQPPGPMHMTLQLDSFNANPGSVVYMDVDWAHLYPVAS